MKRTFIALVVLGAGFSPTTAQTTKEKPGQAGTVRVAVVNMGVILQRYHKSNEFQQELWARLKRFKAKAKKLTDEMKAWHDTMQEPGFDPNMKPRYEAGIRNNQQKLEEMNVEVKNIVAKWHEDHDMMMWKEIQEAIKTCATQNGIELVLGYRELTVHELELRSTNRERQAIGDGSAVPLFMEPGTDISQEIVDLLNKQHREKSKRDPSKGTANIRE
jgi:Skp family chaperone for outer membrane proteins